MGSLPLCSSDEHWLWRRMQGPMEEISSSDFEHRQVRSEALQPMLEAVESRQVRAHWGNWLMRLFRSLLDVEVGAEPEPVVVADWAAAEATKIAAVVKKVVICMLGECAVVLIF